MVVQHLISRGEGARAVHGGREQGKSLRHRGLQLRRRRGGRRRQQRALCERIGSRKQQLWRGGGTHC